MYRTKNIYCVRFLYKSELRNYCVVEASNDAEALTKAMKECNYPEWISIADGFQTTIELFNKPLEDAPLVSSNEEKKHAERTIEGILLNADILYQIWADSIPTDSVGAIDDTVVFELTKQKLIELIHKVKYLSIYAE